MTGKDFLKLLLCIYEYDTDIEIETERNFGDLTYDVTATNKRTLDVYHGFDEGLYSATYSIIKYMSELREDAKNMIVVYEEGEPEDDGHSFPPELSPAPSYKWALFPIKDILDDDFRDNVRKKWIEQKKYMDMYNDFFKEVDKQIQDSMPCRNGICEDRVWTDMSCVDNCEKNYYMNCPKLLEWHEYVKNVRSKRNKEWNKYCEENGIVNPYKN